MRLFTLTIGLFFGLIHNLYGEDQVYASDDYIATKENQEVLLDVLNNDVGLDKGVAKLELLVQPENGQAIVQDDMILYKPDYSFAGDDFFTYEVCNVDGSCGTADVRVKVQDIDFFPEAKNDTLIYYHGSSESYDFLENDFIEGDGPMTITFLNDLSDGEYELNEDDELELEFDRAFIGKDSLKYSICDINSDCSEAYIFIYVRHGGDSDFYLPQGFSPNGDGINDTFYVPDFSTYDDVSIAVIDSWGKIVFQSDDYGNDWNGIANEGSYSGRRVPPGTYYYYFKIEGIGKPITGYVYITN